ncbi:MAG TPA: hypothetical protein DCG38_02745 [Eubacteriaceae bacterium]|nr:hypothetical protein [Eubacteriaceae bacterium]
MKISKTKKFILAGAILAVVGGSGAAYAATAASPAEILSDLTGKSTETLYEQRDEGTTFGALAIEEGVQEQFKERMLENKKEILQERVEEERLTQEEADAIYERMEQNQENCDGTAQGACVGEARGLGFGRGSRGGNGFGANR